MDVLVFRRVEVNAVRSAVEATQLHGHGSCPKMSTKSLLCHKISLCESIEQLNDEQCFDVMRLMQKELGYDKLNQVLMKVLFSSTQSWSIESLQRIEKEISSNMSNCALSNKAQNAKKDNELQNENKQLLFPLLQLPIDLINNISLFLNEWDISSSQFEQCCRLFYRMINNLSYLSKSNIILKNYCLMKQI